MLPRRFPNSPVFFLHAGPASSWSWRIWRKGCWNGLDAETGKSQNVWIHWSKLGPVCRQPTESCLMLMWLFRFDHKDWILRDHFNQGLLLHLPAFIYSKIHLDFLFPRDPRPRYFSLRLKTSFAVRLYGEHKKKVTVISPSNFSCKSDLRGWRLSLNTPWHHWVIGFHSWLQPKEDWDQQGQLRACKDMSQCAGGINNGREEDALWSQRRSNSVKGEINEVFPPHFFTSIPILSFRY